ncbi:hypothetical protein [Thermanaerovibrio velox]|uniref:hypothetical protein n=1 Tax=Thermanaerovibrio velox TaxID=108007 RepID=UPI0012EAB014|nr:hypothetical protein [Thermanaerovibrio velox]
MSELGELDLISCVMCGKAFAAPRGSAPFCPVCKDEAVRLYLVIRAMLRDFPSLRLSVRDASELLGVPEEVVKALFAWDYSSPVSGTDGSCPMCGERSNLGGLCDRCRAYVRHRMMISDH